MPIDFPTSPTTGDVYTYQGKSWIWNGTGWDVPRSLSEIGAVQTFANAAARTAAIPSPTEGIVSYLNDSDLLEVYNGIAYKQISGLSGGILQVITGITTTGVTTTSSSFIDSGLSATITPKNINSKILVLTQQSHQIAKDAVTNVEMETRLVRGTTTLSTQRIGHLDNANGTYRVFYGVTTHSILDSPNTTSALVYKTQQSASSTAFSVSQFNNYPSTITLIELAG